MAKEISDGEYYSDANAYSGVIATLSDKTLALEAAGWHEWLTTLFPFSFSEEFSDDHCKFWDLRWSTLLRIRQQKKLLAEKIVPREPEAEEAFFRQHDCFIAADEWVTLLLLGRGLGKSALVESSAVMRGAMLGKGYCLYICETQTQAEEHIGNCKILIEHDESRLAEFYPKMRVSNAPIINGKKQRDRTDLFITASGWVCRAKGLTSSLRGLRVGEQRPDDIKIDDIDGVNDSVAVSMGKLKELTASVAPTQASRHATIDFGQNLILENGVINQIYTGKSDAFAERTIVGVTNTFVNFREGIEYRTYLDEADGRVRHKLLPSAIPSWSGVTVSKGQKWLNDYGLETFLAECQNDFSHQKTEKVFHEFDEARHIISWSAFEKMFGSRYIPPHWKAKASADLGYSNLSISAWMWTAAAAQNSPLPSRYFCYRAMSFIQESPDDMAEKIWEEMFPDPATGRRHFEATQSFAEYPELFRLLSLKPRCREFLKDYTFNRHTNSYENLLPVQFAPDADEDDKALFYVKQAEKTFKSQISSWLMSHEKTGEQKTFAQKYGLPVNKTKHFGADDGVAEANHLLRGDFTVPHPFYEDELTLDVEGNATGLYKLGSPYLFFVVDDEQAKAARDDAGMKLLREQVSSQRWTKEKINESGLTKTVPMKLASDFCDAFRIFSSAYIMPESVPLTKQERFQNKVAEIAPSAVVLPNQYVSPEKQMQIQFVEEYAKEQIKIEDGDVEEEEEDSIDKYLEW